MGIAIMAFLSTFQKKGIERCASSYTPENGSLIYWRARILFSIHIVILILGSFALVSGVVTAMKENAWRLAFFDVTAYFSGTFFTFTKHLKYEIRAYITVLMFYLVGMAVILSVSPLSGGAAWLFAFAVLAGILLGFWPALVAIWINAVSLSTISWLMMVKKIGIEVKLNEEILNIVGSDANI